MQVCNGENVTGIGSKLRFHKAVSSGADSATPVGLIYPPNFNLSFSEIGTQYQL